VENYIAYIEGQTHEKLDRLSITGTDDGRVTLGYEMRQPKFERVRRITGYLVGTTDRWNNAKQAEEHERVKHGLH
jgi:anaerobic ribonucleoside-triphosphate reductase